MLKRLLPSVLAVLALACFVSQAALADDKNNTHEGKVVKAGDGKLTMTDKDGKNQQTHKVAAAAKISCDGKDCKLEDLKEGYQVKVTLSTGADKEATKIEATTKKKDK